MRKTQYLLLSLIFFLLSCSVKKTTQSVKHNEIERILKKLSADDMQGRATFSAGNDKAASFISDEFEAIGLKPLEGAKSFRQEFSMERVKADNLKLLIDGKEVSNDAIMVITDLPTIRFTQSSGLKVISIGPGQSFFKRYEEILQLEEPVLVLVDEIYSDAFKRLRESSTAGRIIQKSEEQLGAAIFILGVPEVKNFELDFKNQIENLPLSNVVGIIPGRSKEKELVIFSAHYDHLGILKPLENDSIANGADDDASGVTAVISLAKHYKQLNNNERTLIFVAFTAEEIGGYGSHYFSERLNPSDVIAMFNIEMIGKDSKFGKNSAFITGYDKSDFGKILKRNLIGTDFTFYPDPYPDQNLFYRSDNANLAALGVPAHTISTDQIDVDKFYHTVKDEYKTLDINNIWATIQAIALSSRSIVSGVDTPKRIEPLKEN